LTHHPPAAQAENEACKELERASRPSQAGVAGLSENERRRQREVGRGAVLIPRESGGGPLHTPCLMRGSRFLIVGLPSGRLLFFISKSYYLLIKVLINYYNIKYLY
jgi:hypothetical protein